MKNLFFTILLYFNSVHTLLAQHSTGLDTRVIELEKKIELETDYESKVKILKKLGEIQTQENLKTSKNTFKKLYDLASVKKDTITMSQSLVELMWRSISLYNSEEAIKYASLMETLIKDESEDDSFYLAKAKSTKANANILTGKFEKSLENALVANELYEKIKDKSSYRIKTDIINNYFTIATVYQYTENYDSALQSLNIALELSKQNKGLKSFLGKIYNLKGDIYLSKKKYEKSLINYKKGLAFFNQSKDSTNISISLKKIGYYYDKTDRQNKSIHYYKEALNISKKTNDKNVMSYLYSRLGYVSYRVLNENELALKYIDSSLSLSKHFKMVYMQITGLLNKARIYQKMGENNSAINILEQSFLLFDNSKDYQKEAMSIHKMLAELYKNKNYIDKSFYNSKKYIEKKEKLIENKANAKTKILEVKYNFRNITSKLEKKEIALELSEIKQKRFKTNIYFIILSIVTIFCFIVFIILKQRKQAKTERLVLESKKELLEVKKEILDREVKFKSKNITDFAIQINEKNVALENIKKQLKEIKPANNYSKKVLFDTILFINDDINQNTEKIQLYSNVNNNNKNFEAKLNERYNDLTHKEFKVATMVRIGKTSKQIAKQLNISVASVDNYRYTIRKKMKVPKGEHLGTFIKNI